MAADDWIKMRGALLDHPKVIAMTRRLLENPDFRDWLTPGGGGQINGEIVSRAASRCVTVALVMCVWSTARSHGKFDGDDLHLPHSALGDLDEFAGAPGVGEVMREVGWAEIRKGQPGIFLPRFKEFNVPMTEAERSRAYRERKSRGVTESATTPSRKRSDERPEIVMTRVRVRSTTTPALDSTTGARATSTPVEKAGTATPPASPTRTAAPAPAGLDPGLAPIPTAVREAITRSAKSAATHEPQKRRGRPPRATPPATEDATHRARAHEPAAEAPVGPRDGSVVDAEGGDDERAWWRDEEGVLAAAGELGVVIVEGQDFTEFKCRVLAARGPGPWMDELTRREADRVGHYQAFGVNPEGSVDRSAPKRVELEDGREIQVRGTR